VNIKSSVHTHASDIYTYFFLMLNRCLNFNATLNGIKKHNGNSNSTAALAINKFSHWVNFLI